MERHELDALRIDANLFLQQNGFVWRVCDIANPPDEIGAVTLSCGVCLSLDMLFGYTSRVSGLICVAKSGRQIISGRQVICFSAVDSVVAAQELLLGAYDLFLTTENQPVLLEWDPELQHRLRAYEGAPLPSIALRETLLRMIAESSDRDDEMF